MRKSELLRQFPNATKEQLADALDWCLIGGNHLVGAVSGLIGPVEDDWHLLTSEQVSDLFNEDKITYEAYEVWTAWRCCMDSAELLRSTGECDV